MEANGINYKELYDQVRSEASLELNYARLTLAEKTAILVSTLLVVIILTLVAVTVLFFVAWATLRSLEAALGSLWGATAIVVAVLALIALLLWTFRKPLIINPVARFVSKLLINSPLQQ